MSDRYQLKARRYPCPRDDCDGVFRQAPTVGRREEYRCSECDERWPK